MSDQEVKQPTGMRRRTKVLLAASLGLNMLVIGAAGGMLFHKEGPDHIRDTAYGPYARALSHDDRKIIGKALRAETGDFRQNRAKVRASYGALRQALTAEVYDRALVHELINQQQANGLKRYQVGQRLLLKRIDAMSPQERKDFAKRLGPRSR